MKRVDLGSLLERERTAALQEARLFQQFHHPNIIAFRVRFNFAFVVKIVALIFLLIAMCFLLFYCSFLLINTYFSVVI